MESIEEGEVNDDAFDKAKFYTARETETLTCETVEEALTEWVEMRVSVGMTDEQVEKLVRDHGPITVEAFQPRKVDDAWIRIEAQRVLENFIERFCEEFGDPDGSTDVDGTRVIRDPKIEARAVELLRVIVDGTGVWQCVEVGRREYDADAVLAMLAFGGYLGGAK